MKQRVIHIGYPKCASTTLQHFYFSMHPEIFFLGLGTNNGKRNQERYMDEDLANCFEMDLRYKKEALLDYPKLESVFKKNFDMAEGDTKSKIVVASNEILSFTFSYDIDVSQKADRLLRLFGKGTHILVFLRNQFDLIKSLYSEYLKYGLTLSFQDFVNYQLLHDYRFFLSDLLYDKTLEIYEDRFGKEFIHPVLFEDYKTDFGRFATKFSSLFNISDIPLDFGHKNKSVEEQYVSQVLSYNQDNRHNLGNTLFEGSNLERIELFLKKEKAGMDLSKFGSDIQKRKTVKSIFSGKKLGMRSLKNIFGSYPKNVIEYTELQKDQLQNYFAASNANIQTQYQMNLKQYNYPL